MGAERPLLCHGPEEDRRVPLSTSAVHPVLLPKLPGRTLDVHHLLHAHGVIAPAKHEQDATAGGGSLERELALVWTVLLLAKNLAAK